MHGCQRLRLLDRRTDSRYVWMRAQESDAIARPITTALLQRLRVRTPTTQFLDPPALAQSCTGAT